MFATAVLLFALNLAAPGEIHRCVGPDGRERFQDRPCAGAGKGKPFKVDASGRIDSTALRQWLKELPQRSSENATPDRNAAPAVRGATGAMSFTGSERQLAACSQFFLECADDDPFRTDACVFQLPQCASAASGLCCPPDTLHCYRALRRSGSALAVAVRGALLDPRQPACAPFP